MYKTIKQITTSISDPEKQAFKKVVYIEYPRKGIWTLTMVTGESTNKKGEKFFRLEEKKEVLKSLGKSNSVIALGGGAFIDKTIRDNILKNAISIWLDANLKDLNKRIKWNKKRPLLNKENNQKKINKLYDDRKNIYKLANHRINCDNLSKENIAKKIITCYEKYQTHC